MSVLGHRGPRALLSAGATVASPLGSHTHILFPPGLSFFFFCSLSLAAACQDACAQSAPRITTPQIGVCPLKRGPRGLSGRAAVGRRSTNFLGIPRMCSDRSMNFLGIPRIFLTIVSHGF